uniref:Secreted protein n=1 Tax=Rhizophora mucronata TaxID=61149 RepID=A0A2P2NV16_RHIMU
MRKFEEFNFLCLCLLTVTEANQINNKQNKQRTKRKIKENIYYNAYKNGNAQLLNKKCLTPRSKQ